MRVNYRQNCVLCIRYFERGPGFLLLLMGKVGGGGRNRKEVRVVKVE